MKIKDIIKRLEEDNKKLREFVAAQIKINQFVAAQIKINQRMGISFKNILDTLKLLKITKE